ncbi:hypothetical protein CPC08DRAFT_753686 [Agrocybe pediades]|nr:hypothetical protein CPC08DRAFT_753686 [Agrocybe pediades]
MSDALPGPDENSKIEVFPGTLSTLRFSSCFVTYDLCSTSMLGNLPCRQLRLFHLHYRGADFDPLSKVSRQAPIAPAMPFIFKRDISVGCSADAIGDAIFGAVEYVLNASDYMTVLFAITPSPTWFGAYDSSRRNAVNGHIQAIVINRFADFIFGTVYLCPLFCEASTLGTNSKAQKEVTAPMYINGNNDTRHLKISGFPVVLLPGATSRIRSDSFLRMSYFATIGINCSTTGWPKAAGLGLFYVRLLCRAMFWKLKMNETDATVATAPEHMCM